MAFCDSCKDMWYELTDGLCPSCIAKKNIFWLEELKKGGYIIFFRHAEREKWREAVFGFDAYEVSKKLNAREHSWYRATCLTERGIETAKMIGISFNHAEIEIQKIFSSPKFIANQR